MRYRRREYLDLALRHQDNPHHKGTDFVEEVLYSLANLHVAAEAHAFVGTLSSNWCMMVSGCASVCQLCIVNVQLITVLFCLSRRCADHAA